MSRGADQQQLDFNPIKATPEGHGRMRRLIAQWRCEKAEEDFQQLPDEPLDVLETREQYLGSVNAFGPTMSCELSEAWQMMRDQSRPLHSDHAIKAAIRRTEVRCVT